MSGSVILHFCLQGQKRGQLQTKPVPATIYFRVFFWALFLPHVSSFLSVLRNLISRAPCPSQGSGEVDGWSQEKAGDVC